MKRLTYWDERAVGKELWVTIDGRVIPYQQLTDEHLANCIKMLTRMDNQVYEEGGLRNVAKMHWKAYKALLLEQKRRRIFT